MRVLVHKGPAKKSKEDDITDNGDNPHSAACPASGNHHRTENQSQELPYRENNITGFLGWAVGRKN